MASSLPELQRKLYKRLGVGGAGPAPNAGNVGGGRRGARGGSRQQQRKALRDEKKQRRYQRSEPERPKPRTQPKPSHGTFKNSRRAEPELADQMSDDDSIDGSGGGDNSGPDYSDDGLDNGSDAASDNISGEGSDVDDGDDGLDHLLEHGDSMSEDGSEDGSSDADEDVRSLQKPKGGFDREDAEIADYERKLGIKSGRKGLPQSFKEDGLDEIFGDLEGGEGEAAQSEDEAAKKRKREDDDWLASKRRKAAMVNGTVDNDAGSFAGFSDDGTGSGSDSDDAEDDDHGIPSRKRENPYKVPVKENPYKAPTTCNVAAAGTGKYIPPALRRAGEQDGDARLRKQVQGLINRLTDDNILSIVQSVRELYSSNARGAVTEIITDVIIDQIYKPEALPDQFFVLSGGFCAALYMVVGSSFGSHVIDKVVKQFGAVYERVLADHAEADAADIDASAIPKEPSNLIAFLTQLYTFEVVSSNIIFDYMQKLLRDLNELNVELLLRMCRMAGPILRKDNAQALKNISVEIGKAVEADRKQAKPQLSSRTRALAGLIMDLQKRKKKARGVDSGAVSETVQRMKKRLGDFKSQTKRLEGTAPMGMTLDDIEGQESRGKWWLVGASVPAREKPRSGAEATKRTGHVADEDDGGFESDHEDMSIYFPDYAEGARRQNLLTDAEVAIYTALMSGTGVKDGYRRLKDLKLKKNDRQRQVARILVQLVGSQQEYNGYFAEIASLASKEGRIRFPLKARLWEIFRALGEPLFDEAADDDGDSLDTQRFQDERRLRLVAMFYADLTHEGVMSLDWFKPLEMHTMSDWSMKFMLEYLLDLMDGCRGKKEEATVAKLFGPARDMPALAAGLAWLLRDRDPIKKQKKLGPKKRERLIRVSETAQKVLEGV